MLKKFSYLGIVSIVIGLATIIWFQSDSLFKTLNSKKVNKMTSQEQEKQEQSKNKINDPCWFNSKNGLESASYEMIMDRQNREAFGYEKEISLAEAIKIFNEELRCSPLFKDYPPLTEDEIIGAIVAGPDVGGKDEARIVQSDLLWKIAKEKTLPKSSLLHFGSGGQVMDSPLSPYTTIAPEGITIYLTLGIDKEHSFKSVKPNQIFLIRKFYKGIKEIK